MVINDIVRKNASFIEKTIAFFSALCPVFCMDPLTGEPSVSITVEPSQEDMTIRSIFNYLNESGKEVYIAIDEFQQIAEYPEKGTEALLRSYIQFALLKAIAKEGIVEQPTAGKFIKEHNLKGASSAKAALKALEDKELVYRKAEGYIIYDRFMDLWLKRG